MKYIFVILLFPFLLCSQDESNDPQATILLENVNAKLLAQQELKLPFELVFSSPGMEDEREKGEIIQSENKYKVSLKNQTIINSGDILYIVFHDMASIQMNNVQDGENSNDIFNPRKIAELYKSKDFVYAITGEEDFDGARVINVEFKPLDRFNEYSKIRVAIGKKSGLPVYAKFFAKDGTRISLEFEDFNFSPQLSADLFIFNPKEYPNYEIEDLRID